MQFLPLCPVSSIIHCWRACKVPTICVLPPVWCLYCPPWSWLDIVFDIDWIFLYIFATSMKSLLPLRYWSDIVFDIDIDWICLDIFATSVMSLLPPTILIGFPSQSICKQSKLQQIAVAINLLLVHMTQRRVLSLMWFKGNFSFNIMYCFTSPNKPSFCQTL